MGEQFQFGIWPASAMTPHREVPKSHSSSAFGNLRRREAMDETDPRLLFTRPNFSTRPSASEIPTGRLSLRVTEHNLSGRRDRTYSADPRQSGHRRNSWSSCFECSFRGMTRRWWSGPNDTALDR